jgi:hypothetical protein
LGTNTYVVSSVTKLTFTRPLCGSSCIHTIRLFSSFAGDQAGLGQDVPNQVIGTLYQSVKGSTKDLYSRKWYYWSVSIISCNITVRSMPLK